MFSAVGFSFYLVLVLTSNTLLTQKVHYLLLTSHCLQPMSSLFWFSLPCNHSRCIVVCLRNDSLHRIIREEFLKKSIKFLSEPNLKLAPTYDIIPLLQTFKDLNSRPTRLAGHRTRYSLFSEWKLD